MATASAMNSATPTIVEDRSDTHSLNDEFEHQFFPGPEAKERDHYLVEFDQGDPLNPKVSLKCFPLIFEVLIVFFYL